MANEFQEIDRFIDDAGELMYEQVTPSTAKVIFPIIDDRNNRTMLGTSQNEFRGTIYGEPRPSTNQETTESLGLTGETYSQKIGSYENDFRVSVTATERELSKKQLHPDLTIKIKMQTDAQERHINNMVFKGTTDGEIVGLRTLTGGDKSFYAAEGALESFRGYRAKSPTTKYNNVNDPPILFKSIDDVVVKMRRSGVYPTRARFVLSNEVYSTLDSKYFANSNATVMDKLRDKYDIAISDDMEKDIAIMFPDQLGASILYSYNIMPLGPAMTTSKGTYYADFGWRCSGLTIRNKEAVGIIPAVIT